MQSQTAPKGRCHTIGSRTFHRMVVFVDKVDIHLELLPHPGIKNLSIVGRQPIPGIQVSKRLSHFAKEKEWLVQIIPFRNPKEFRQRIRPVKAHDGRLQKVLPPDPMRGHAREGPRIDHFLHDVCFEGRGVKANQQVSFQYQTVGNDDFQLIQRNDVENSRLGFFHIGSVLQFGFGSSLLRVPAESPLLLLSVSSAPATHAGVVRPPRSIVAFPAGFIAQYFKGLNDLVKGRGGLFGRHVLVLIGMRIEGLFPVGLFDFLCRSGSSDSQEFIEIRFLGGGNEHDEAVAN